MTKEQIREVIFNMLIFMQGSPPIDTQLAEWEKAIDEIYEVIVPNLSFSIG